MGFMCVPARPKVNLGKGGEELKKTDKRRQLELGLGGTLLL